MVKLIDLSKNRVKGVRSIEATFMVDGELNPLRVTEEDRPESYDAISRILQEPNLDVDEIEEEIYSLMSPVANVRKTIDSSFYLSDNMSIEGGVLKFGDHVLEETLSNHMLSLLDEENTPKDEKLWKSYVTFLDNLHQNVNEDIRKQLFRWMDYENKAGNGFGITEDGCIVGYKGCGGTIFEPVSVFTGTAIVDGVEVNGKIPNKVGSVIKMPRSSVQYDPNIGCSVGLHVGTRDYAVNWAPILLLVKVNPRDVVSVPYECESQKIRVCEYTVLKVTDASEEHKMYHPEENEYEDEYVEPNPFDEADFDQDDFELDEETALDLIGEEIYIEYDDSEKSFMGVLSDVYLDGYNTGIIIRSSDDDPEYKHIKLHRISYYDVQEVEEEPEETEEETEEQENDEELQAMIKLSIYAPLEGKRVKVHYGGHKEIEGILTSIYDKKDSPGLIIRTDHDGTRHIKIERISSVEDLGEENNLDKFHYRLKSMIDDA